MNKIYFFLMVCLVASVSDLNAYWPPKDKLAGTTTGVPTNITIGLLGTYTSLTNAFGLFADINARGLSGNTTVTIIDPTIVETASYALNQMSYDGGGPYTLTIKPAALGTVLTGAISNGALLQIKSSNVIIDGSKNGTNSQDLSVLNTSVTSPFVFLLGSTGTTPASNITIKNCIVANGINTSSAIVLGDAATVGGEGYFNNISFQNMNVRNAYIGIYCVGVQAPGNGSGLNITSNKLNTSGTSAIRNVGIYVQGVDGATISGNDVGNFESITDEIDFGILLATGTSNSTVDKNIVHDIKYTGLGGYGAKGITIASDLAASNNTVSNNMIYDVTGDGDSYSSYGAYYSPVGIYVVGTGQGGVNIYHNSIYLSGATLDFAADVYSFGIALDNNSAATVKNNIVLNQLGLSSGVGVGPVCIAAKTSAAQFTSLDNNDYYSNATLGTNLIGKIAGTNYNTLTAWKVATGKEVNSLNVQPNFTSSTDLHMVTTNNCALDGYGTPTPGATIDYDGQTRDPAAPDMGADEFSSLYSGSLAGVSDSAICENKTVSGLGTTYASSACGLIAKVLPSGDAPVAGKINTCVTLDASQQYFNAEPYLQRHYDIEPAVSNATTSATITLYFTDAEFVNYNTNTVAWPKLPTVSGGGNADPNIANLKITQYHGTATTNPSTPGNYSANGGSGFYINPNDANIVWNGSYWAVTFDVTGFSGFYVHTNPAYPLPVSFNYLNGTKQDNDHLLTWSVTCNSTPRVTLTLERSADSRNFNSIYSITADAVRCNQPFNYTDAQPLPGINYYRLKIVDVDGKITYSNTIALINGTRGFDLVSIAPNPVTGNSCRLNATAAVQTKMEIQVMDLMGRVVQRQTVVLAAGYNSITMNLVGLARGTYNVSAMTAEGRSRLLRFVKQ